MSTYTLISAFIVDYIIDIYNVLNLQKEVHEQTGEVPKPKHKKQEKLVLIILKQL